MLSMSEVWTPMIFPAWFEILVNVALIAMVLIAFPAAALLAAGDGVLSGYYLSLRPSQIPETNEKQHGDCPDE